VKSVNGCAVVDRKNDDYITEDLHTFSKTDQQFKRTKNLCRILEDRLSKFTLKYFLLVPELRPSR
jgi:hypothetical protein